MSGWYALRNEPIAARLAVPADRAQVSALLRSTWRHHGSQMLDDQAVMLQSGLSALAFTRAEAIGFLGVTARTPAGDPPETWADVNLVGISSKQPVDDTLARLLRQTVIASQAAGCTGLVCLTGQDWLRDGLMRVGFAEIDKVVSYAHSDPGKAPAVVEVAQIQPAEARHAETILALNAAAFTPLWRYGDATVLGWLMSAERAVLAHLWDEPVGFALTTRGTAGSFAHLIRVAAHPAAQGRGVGRQLVTDGLLHAYAAGALGLALNTQASNTVSRQLYTELGFRLVDPVLSVLVYRV